MAGIWERVHGDGIDGEGGGRFNVSLLKDCMAGLAFGGLSRAEADSILADGTAFTIEGDVATDVAAIFDEAEQGAAQSNLVETHLLQTSLNLAEVGVIDETKFRDMVSGL